MKIGANFYKKLEEKNEEFSFIEVSVEEETYQIGVRKELSSETRINMVEDFLTLLTTNVSENNEPLVRTELLMAVFKAATDIEFPDDKVERMLQFRALAETGIMEKIIRAMGDDFIRTEINFIEVTLAGLAEQVKKKAEEELDILQNREIEYDVLPGGEEMVLATEEV